MIKINKNKLVNEYAGINILPANGHGTIGDLGDASFIGPDGKMKGGTKRSVYKVPKSSIHNKKNSKDLPPEMTAEDEEGKNKTSYINDKSVPKNSIHNQKFGLKELDGRNPMGTVSDASFIGKNDMYKGNSRKPVFKTPKSSIHYKKGKFENEADFYNVDNWETDVPGPSTDVSGPTIYVGDKSVPKNSIHYGDKPDEDRHYISTQEQLGMPVSVNGTIDGGPRSMDPIASKKTKKKKFADASKYGYPKESVKEEKDYDDNVVPKTSIHYGERDKVSGEKQMKFKEVAQSSRFKSDAEIENSYKDFNIDEFKFDNDRQKSGFISIDFPKRECTVDNFIIYGDGKVAFENWYPDEVYFKLVEYIYKNVTDINVKNKIKSVLASKGYSIKENLMSTRESLLIKKVSDLKNIPTQDDWKSNLSKAVMNLTPEAQPKERGIPVPKVPFGETPEFPYKNQRNGSMVYPIPGEGQAIKKGNEWTFGDTPQLPSIAAQDTTNGLGEPVAASCKGFGEPYDDMEIDIPCTKRPLIKKLMMFIKNEQKNLHEGISLKGLYEGKVVKLNTIFEGEHRMFKTFVKTNEGTIKKIHFGPNKTEKYGMMKKKKINENSNRLLEWIDVNDKLPDKQIEVVFYAKPYEWWTGMFTPKGKYSEEPVFQYHQHWGDDNYHTVENVTHWMPLPPPKRRI